MCDVHIQLIYGNYKMIIDITTLSVQNTDGGQKVLSLFSIGAIENSNNFLVSTSHRHIINLVQSC